MTYDRLYQQNYKAQKKLIANNLGPRFRSGEGLPGETYTQFEKRIVKEEINKVQQEAKKIYPAWVKMPNETSEEFRKRLTAKSIEDKPTYPAWKKAPNETPEQFKKRFTKLE